MFLAILAGLAGFLGANAILGGVYGLACGSSQTLNLLLRFSLFALPIKLAAWAATLWAGWAMFQAVAPV